jgi:ribosomal-protein-alanine N-acetyltransferase
MRYHGQDGNNLQSKGAIMIREQTEIRWLIRRDMKAVRAIESASYDFPWSESEWAANLKVRNTIARVIELDGQVVGYVVYQLHKDVIEILNLAVKPIERRSGHGRLMMETLKGTLSQSRRTKIEATLCEANLSGQLFLQSCGLRAVRVIREAWNECDAYLFRLSVKERI